MKTDAFTFHYVYIYMISQNVNNQNGFIFTFHYVYIYIETKFIRDVKVYIYIPLCLYLYRFGVLRVT